MADTQRIGGGIFEEAIKIFPDALPMSQSQDMGKIGLVQDLIRGIKMYDGTMFATLLYYLDETFRQEHPFIYFNTQTEQRIYEVVYGFYQEVDGSTWTEGYYKYDTLEEFEVFQEYAVTQDVLGGGGEISYDDELLSLITCSGFDDDIRFVLVVRRVE